MNQPPGNKKTGPGNYEPSPITQWKQLLHEKCVSIDDYSTWRAVRFADRDETG